MSVITAAIDPAVTAVITFAFIKQTAFHTATDPAADNIALTFIRTCSHIVPAADNIGGFKTATYLTYYLQ
ncbi:hypothetical protein FACS1894133_6780 [Clostridia bacterium]|nr:hypothetical protein FACS1894133_6780 [Clostridia bacterium]